MGIPLLVFDHKVMNRPSKRNFHRRKTNIQMGVTWKAALNVPHLDCHLKLELVAQGYKWSSCTLVGVHALKQPLVCCKLQIWSMRPHDQRSVATIQGTRRSDWNPSFRTHFHPVIMRSWVQTPRPENFCTHIYSRKWVQSHFFHLIFP